MEKFVLLYSQIQMTGKYGLDDIHLINVWNGLDHFSGTKDRVDNFRDGVDLVFEILMECTAICNNLKVSMNDNDVSSTIGKGVEVIKSVAYNLNKLFVPSDESDTTTLQPKKKKKKSQEPGETRTDVQSKFTLLHCACGVKFAS